MPVPYTDHIDEYETVRSEGNTESLDENLEECQEDETEGLAKIVFPNLEFKVTKRHHRKRWLKQDRLLKLTQEGIENINVYTGKVSKSHSYSSVTGVKLVNRRYFVLSFKNDHDYHYKSDNGIRITWEVNERLKAIESRKRFKNFINRRMSTTNPKHKFSEVFRTNRVPVPVDQQKNLIARRMEGILQLRLTDEIMDPKSTVGKKAIASQLHIDSLLKSKSVYPGTSILNEVRGIIHDLKTILCTECAAHDTGSFDSTVSNHSFGGEITATVPLSPRSNASIRIKDTLKNNRSMYGSAPVNRTSFGSSVQQQPWISGGMGTEEEVSKTAELCVQKHLLHHANNFEDLYKLVKSDPSLRVKGSALREKIKEVKSKPPSFFGIPRSFVKCIWSDVVREVDLIAVKHLPAEKAECLLSMIRQICIVTSVDSGSTPIDMTLDEILPICLYCISRSSLEDPFVEAEYMSLLCDSASSDEIMYYLTVFFSALEFLLTMEPDNPLESPPDIALAMTRASSAPLTQMDSSVKLSDEFFDVCTPVESVDSLEEAEGPEIFGGLSRSSSCNAEAPRSKEIPIPANKFDAGTNCFSDVQFVW